MGAYTDVINDLEDQIEVYKEALQEIKALVDPHKGKYWFAGQVREVIENKEAQIEHLSLQDEAVPSPGEGIEEDATATTPGWCGLCTDAEREM